MVLIEEGNFHTIVPGTLYRSAQLEEKQLTDYINAYGIKSILNLRGEHKLDTWYQGEMRVASQFGLAHYDYPISKQQELGDQQIRSIVAILRDAPKPLLIHCKNGVDRSGLIAALFLYAIEGKPAQDAYDQLSIFYGHFPYLGSESNAMDRSFWRYVNSHR
jgi:protein tyrosine/serine phosphatase